MERVLRQPDRAEIDSQFARSFDLAGPLAVYPVRHHSPGCARHLLAVLREYRPGAVLVEGPSDASDLIPLLVCGESAAPFCIYYSYDDREGRVSDAKEKYRAYYPFLDYSPELAVLREAARMGVHTEFIDLPYAARLVNPGPDGRAGEAVHLGGNEEYEANRFTARLARDAGCRCFAEFWESRYELAAAQMDTREFVRAVFALGYLMRLSSPVSDGDRLRESFMARRIAEAVKTVPRVLVVTGAFHVAGLLEQPQALRLRPHSRPDVACYVMPYTFREADSAGGYAAGMPFPAYYQRVWEKDGAFLDTALEYIVKTARFARRTQPVSLPDEIQAFSMARSLAALRGKPAPGVYELLDGVRSAFVKGELGSTATFELDFLVRQLTGMGAGTVASGAGMPPVVQDFRAKCARFRLKTGTVERQEVTLEIVKNAAHLEKSRFLHQLLFLGAGFGQLASGPDYVSGRDRNLTREVWTCRYSTGVETRLVDLSVYGTTVPQVCAALIERQFGDSLTAASLGKLLLSVQVMGVERFFGQAARACAETIDNDRNFGSLCALTGSLRTLAAMQRLAGGEDPLVGELAARAFSRACGRMGAVRACREDEEQAVCERLRELYTLSAERPEWCDGALFARELDAALGDGLCNSRFYGLCLAIRSKQGGIAPEAFCERVAGYLESCAGQTKPEAAASFLCGVFLAARDVFFADERVLGAIDRVLRELDAERFLTVLPDLRYAFTSFLPAELERAGRMVAARCGGNAADLSGSAAVSREEAALGMRLDALAARQMTEWGLNA